MYQTCDKETPNGKFVNKGTYVSRHSISENISKYIKITLNIKLSQYFFYITYTSVWSL